MPTTIAVAEGGLGGREASAPEVGSSKKPLPLEAKQG